MKPVASGTSVSPRPVRQPRPQGSQVPEGADGMSAPSEIKNERVLHQVMAARIDEMHPLPSAERPYSELIFNPIPAKCTDVPDAFYSARGRDAGRWTNVMNRFSAFPRFIFCPPAHSQISVAVGDKVVGMHANRVDMEPLGLGQIGIASERPLPGRNAGLFWSMVAQQRVKVIVNLSDLMDKPADRYFPANPGWRGRYGGEGAPVSVNMLHASEPVSYAHNQIRRYSLRILPPQGDPWTVTMLHCPMKDFRAPDLHRLGALIDAIKAEGGGDGDTLVHCDAGAGRSGLVLSAMALRAIHDSGADWGGAFAEVPQRVVAQGRFMRGAYFVENAGQFQALQHYWESLHGKPLTKFE